MIIARSKGRNVHPVARSTPKTTNVMMAFTADQMARLAGISRRQLRYWERSGVFSAHRVMSPISGPYQTLYSYQDLVNLRVMAKIRMAFRVPLKEIREVSRYIERYASHPWSGLALRVYGKHLAFRDPETGQWMSALPAGQIMLELQFSDVEAESEALVKRLFTRRTEDIGKIHRHRNVMSNVPVFAGTRIPVRVVQSFLDEGHSDDDILRQYPTLHRNDLIAARAYVNGTIQTA